MSDRRETPLFRSRHVLWLILAALLIGVWLGQAAADRPKPDSAVRGWEQGKGYGWRWGKDDQVGALNALTDASRLAAAQLIREGKTYDLGIRYSARSYKWPGHSPGAIMSFRSPEGVKRQLDNEFIEPANNPLGQGWHSCALFISDNVGTQIDGLAHITVGKDNHWYNGFTEAEWGGDFGVRKCDACQIPPIVARGVLLDMAGLKKVDALPAHYAITPGDVDQALAKQKVKLLPGDVVFFRTGAMRFWGEDGADLDKLKEHDSAGITLETAKYLVENFGSVMLGSDTSGLEVGPAAEGSPTFIPVHNYLLIEQGVYIGEFHDLEALARDGVYEFCYFASVNKIAGAVAGFTLRPVAMK